MPRTAIVHFITHPEVTIDPSVAVPDWPLSQAGIRRASLLPGRPWMREVRAMFCSTERKARDTADIIAGPLALRPVAIDELGENDRSATGYLPKTEFESVAATFFADPEHSVRGWERAIDAQRRIVAAVDDAITYAPPEGDIAIVSHGGVGTLLLCHLKRLAISGAEDQPGAGGGNIFAFERLRRRLISSWCRLEDYQR